MISHYLIAVVLIIALIAVTVPSLAFMPTMAEMTILVVIAVLVVAYAGLLLAEGDGDERENLHRAAAGRAGFIAGTAVLTLALLYQGFTHSIDPWIPAALGVMIIAKVATRGWHHHHS